ncbi:MAG: ABC transporter ATP-binding protein [Ekhidna sp.]|nr:ABC transporter ATP-binding protein [Ekhidna sp.]
MVLLSTENLSIGYGEKVLAKALSLELKAGELVGLIGQNGVGKSTLIRTLAGLQTKLSGEIHYNGTFMEKPKELAKLVSIVLTGKPDTLNLSVVELLALGRHPYTGWLGYLKEDDKKKIEKALSLMEINYIANKKLFELSDGQLQKAMIARALAQDTKVIILDEPTSHLDLKNKIDVLELLKKISNQGKCVLISTHEVGLAGKYCDRFWCMDFGEEMLMGEPQHLIKEGNVQQYLHIERDRLL